MCNRLASQIFFQIERKSVGTQSYPLSRDLQLSLYRILQEQLRNILKHANATSIEVGLAIDNNILQMRIKDNGVGFDAGDNKGGIGLANMISRIKQVYYQLRT